MNRRDFFRVMPAIAAPLAGLSLPPAEGHDGDGRMHCQWFEGDQQGCRWPFTVDWVLWIGQAPDDSDLATIPAAIEGRLFRRQPFSQPTEWTFRCGRLFTHFHDVALSDAKKMAEQKMVEWVEWISRSLGKTAFDLNVSKTG